MEFILVYAFFSYLIGMFFNSWAFNHGYESLARLAFLYTTVLSAFLSIFIFFILLALLFLLIGHVIMRWR